MEKQRAQQKTQRLPIKPDPTRPMLRKPEWIRIKVGASSGVKKLKNLLRENNLHTVCEEASCPNLAECFSGGKASFMIMGDICTRRCPFCDVAHGKPKPLDVNEPKHLADVIQKMGLTYVVITSVDRDDLRDGGAEHFIHCIQAMREQCPDTKIEILTPDFRGRMDIAIQTFKQALPDVFNHNLETVPRLYKQARPGADYQWSLDLIKKFKQHYPNVPTKSGLMVGIGETKQEVLAVMEELRAHECDLLTIGQYLQPSKFHLAVERYVEPAEFDFYRQRGEAMGFTNVASAPFVRSSYHADLQAVKAI